MMEYSSKKCLFFIKYGKQIMYYATVPFRWLIEELLSPSDENCCSHPFMKFCLLCLLIGIT